MADEEFTIFEPARQTVGDIALSDFQRYDARLRIVGVLTPIAGHTSEKLAINESEVVIGRDPKSNIVLSDHGVSRRHARIYQTDTDFVVEDLGSSNGTYVDGVPIVSCVLHGGDSVQIGHTLFLFDRLLEHVTDDASNG
ncbi:MAG: pSer/pThr/pTyr-binding forkhead associated (FHA) protein [Planctomycetaceae bacterium]|jgi:pSer/pThr/pTyr-binding forkhead associated (FHA) protein